MADLTDTSELGAPDLGASDPDLLARALAGDGESFTALFRRRQGEIFRFGLQMTGDSGVAEDLVQETFLTLLKVGARFDVRRGPLRAFLYGIARKLVLRHLERGFRPVADEDSAEASTGEDLLDDLTRRETIESVRQAVLSLPPVYREVVVLCDLHESSYDEAALALDCPVGTVRSRLSRGRNLVAKKLVARKLVAGQLAGQPLTDENPREMDEDRGNRTLAPSLTPAPRSLK